jgi:tetratricopeptide (TPR) repeat protein
MWRDAARKSPNKARPHFNLAQALLDSDPEPGDDAIRAADRSFRRALDLDPANVDYASAWNRRLLGRDASDGVLYAAAEFHRLGGRFLFAEDLIRRVLDREGPSARAFYALARIQASSGGIPESLDSLERAIDLGFRDGERLLADPALARVRRSARFRTLLPIIR